MTQMRLKHRVIAFLNSKVLRWCGLAIRFRIEGDPPLTPLRVSTWHLGRSMYRWPQWPRWR